MVSYPPFAELIKTLHASGVSRFTCDSKGGMTVEFSTAPVKVAQPSDVLPTEVIPAPTEYAPKAVEEAPHPFDLIVAAQTDPKLVPVEAPVFADEPAPDSVK